MRKKLFAWRDLSYRDFQARLLPTVASEKIIGVRTPCLRSFAKKILGTEEAALFLRSLPHEYFDENQLHALLISLEPNFAAALAGTEAFLPYVDNWATCDQLRPKAFSQNAEVLLERVRVWLKSSHAYTVRFGVEMLLVHFLDSNFEPDHLRLVAGVKSADYYVNMMCAWYFATALAKQYEAAVVYLEQGLLSREVHGKALRKAGESLRLTSCQKKYLRSLAFKR